MQNITGLYPATPIEDPKFAWVEASLEDGESPRITVGDDATPEMLLQLSQACSDAAAALKSGEDPQAFAEAEWHRRREAS
jgi:hypothetical protein